MNATDDLVNQICMLMHGEYSGELRDLRNKVHIICSNYDISEKTYEVAITNEEANREIIAKFLIAKTVKGCTQKTINLYSGEITKIIGKINKSIIDINCDDLRLYLAIRTHRDKVSKVTVHNEHRYLSAFFGWLYQEEIIKSNPMLRIETKRPHIHKEAFSEMEVELIRANCKTYKERAAVELLLSTGCRSSECAGIKIEDIKSDGSIKVMGKGEKERQVYLNPKALIAIQMYLEERKDKNPYLFPRIKDETRTSKGDWYKNPELVDEKKSIGHGGMRGMTTQIGKRAGIKPCNTHRFRHTCATMALKHGMDLMTVSKMLGHESIGTTQIYIDIDEEQLKQQHKKYVV